MAYKEITFQLLDTPINEDRLIDDSIALCTPHLVVPMDGKEDLDSASVVIVLRTTPGVDKTVLWFGSDNTICYSDFEYLRSTRKIRTSQKAKVSFQT